MVSLQISSVARAHRGVGSFLCRLICHRIEAVDGFKECLGPL